MSLAKVDSDENLDNAKCASSSSASKFRRVRKAWMANSEKKESFRTVVLNYKTDKDKATAQNEAAITTGSRTGARSKRQRNTWKQELAKMSTKKPENTGKSGDGKNGIHEEGFPSTESGWNLTLRKLYGDSVQDLNASNSEERQKEDSKEEKEDKQSLRNASPTRESVKNTSPNRDPVKIAFSIVKPLQIELPTKGLLKITSPKRESLRVTSPNRESLKIDSHIQEPSKPAPPNKESIETLKFPPPSQEFPKVETLKFPPLSQESPKLETFKFPPLSQESPKVETFKFSSLSQESPKVETFKFPSLSQESPNVKTLKFPSLKSHKIERKPKHEDVEVIVISDDDDAGVLHKKEPPKRSVHVNPRKSRAAVARSQLISDRLMPIDSMENIEEKLKLKVGSSEAPTRDDSTQRLKVKTQPVSAYKQRQFELHRQRIAVEQKRLELLEMKLARERDEMLRERVLFEKELELKAWQMRHRNFEEF